MRVVCDAYDMNGIFVQNFTSFFSRVQPQKVNPHQENQLVTNQMYMTEDKACSQLDKLDDSSANRSDSVNPYLCES